MLYQAIARKYRPETFDQMVGQEHVTGTLLAALRHDKLSHAYVFSGPRGCGKTTVARLLAKALNCPDRQDGVPCGVCATCQAIAAGSFLDVLEIDAASNTGVDNVRELREMARLSPSSGNSRVFIIDEVHMLSKGAFNALLKILEEPPRRVFFFFATTEPAKIPRTILSRCQRFDFRLLDREQITGRMQEICAAEKIAIDAGALGLLASLAEGSMRDGLSLLDQAIACGEGEIDEALLVGLFGLIRSEVYRELSEAMLAGDAARGLQLIDRLSTEGQDLVVFARGLLTHFRNLLLLKIDPALVSAIDLTGEQVAGLQVMIGHFGEQDLLQMLERAGVHYERIHRSTQPRIMLEAAVVEFCRWERRVLLSDLLDRLQGLLAGGPAGQLAGSAPGGQAGEIKSDAGRSSRGRSRPVERSQPAAAAAGMVDGWTELVQAIMQQNPGLGGCLMHGLPAVREDDGVLTVAFPPDSAFMLQRVEAGRADLEARITACFGRELKLELVAVSDHADPTADPREAVRREVAPTEAEQLARKCASDPELKRLVTMVRGEVLSESERERWRQTAAPAADQDGPTAAGDEDDDEPTMPAEPPRRA